MLIPYLAVSHDLFLLGITQRFISLKFLTQWGCDWPQHTTNKSRGHPGTLTVPGGRGKAFIKFGSHFQTLKLYKIASKYLNCIMRNEYSMTVNLCVEMAILISAVDQRGSKFQVSNRIWLFPLHKVLTEITEELRKYIRYEHGTKSREENGEQCSAMSERTKAPEWKHNCVPC